LWGLDSIFSLWGDLQFQNANIKFASLLKEHKLIKFSDCSQNFMLAAGFGGAGQQMALDVDNLTQQNSQDMSLKY
jgi:hypothetical protein